MTGTNRCQHGFEVSENVKCRICELEQQVNTLASERDEAREYLQIKQNQVWELDKQRRELKKQVNTLTKSFGSDVVYQALNHYFEQSLFDQEDFDDLDRAMEAHRALQSIKESPREEQGK
ncbi:hypothetical protein [Paenibacillus sp. GYB003]|uniref:hypothetical protein n=1 Tax=Paenibacillus sp. GYB003 TaxID=2994392 RepID=UPI002F96743D